MKETKEMAITLISDKKRERKNYGVPKIEKIELVVYAIGALVARATLPGGIAPFGVVFVTLFRRFSVKSVISLVMSVVGYLTMGELGALRYIGASIVYVGSLFVSSQEEEISPVRALLTVTIAVFAFDVLSMIWEGINPNTIFLTLVDTSLVALGVSVFDRGRHLTGIEDLWQISDNEERLSLFTVLGIALLSFQSISFIPNFSPSNILALTLTGIAGVASGALSGATVGLIFGFLLGLKEDLVLYIGLFTICGYMMGALSNINKTVGCVGFGLTGLILSLYAAGPGTSVYFYEAPAVGILLRFIPDLFYKKVKKFTDFKGLNREEQDGYKDYLQDRVKVVAASFDALAETYEKLSDNWEERDMAEISALFDRATSHVCLNCIRVEKCWKKDFVATRATMLGFFKIMEKKGELSVSDVDGAFAERCPYLKSLVDEINRMYEIYRINEGWKRKLWENKNLATSQIGGVSKILKDIAIEFEQETNCDEEVAERLKLALERENVKPKYIRVIKLQGEQLVELCLKEKIAEQDIEKIEECVSIELNGKFVAENPESALKYGILQMKKEPRLCVETAFVVNGLDEKCGDSHILCNIGGGKFLAAISDGMGTGTLAMQDSEAVVELLKNFMEAGFDKRIAIEMVNSFMIMKSPKESFATIDMCVIDLNNGETEFIKNGAAISYIKRAEGVESVRGSSLPVGALYNMEIESFSHSLRGGDMIIMMSDGLELRESGGGWIKDAVENVLNVASAREVADEIMEKAIGLKGGKIDDDMTIMVLKIKEI